MRSRVAFLFLALVLGITGCATAGPRTKTGAVAGGIIGAATGGIIGHQKGRGLEGAAIGAAIGAASGALVGSAMDDKARQTNPNHLPISSIVDMASRGSPDDLIISEIQRTKSVYHLTAEIITYLKNNNVSDKVIDYMLSTPERY